MAQVRRGLERLARSLASMAGEAEASPQSKLLHDISVALERLDDLRTNLREQRRTLLRQECELETDLRQKLSYRPRIYLHHPRTRDRLRRAVLELRRERRALYATYAQEVAELQDHLFNLTWQCLFIGRSGG